MGDPEKKPSTFIAVLFTGGRGIHRTPSTHDMAMCASNTTYKYTKEDPIIYYNWSWILRQKGTFEFIVGYPSQIEMWKVSYDDTSYIHPAKLAPKELWAHFIL